MNSSEARNVAVNKYFIITPDEPSYVGSIIRMAIGGLGILIGLINGGGFLVLFGGGLFLAGSGLARYLKAKNAYDKAFNIAEPKPSDQQIDDWLSQDKQRIASEAIDKLGLVPEKVLNNQDPLIIIGPLNQSRVVLGKDNIVRFSAYEVVVIYLTDYHLGAYTCILDFINGRNQSEETQEYHYRDVVSVSTRNANTNFSVINLDGAEKPIASHQQFSLSVASGESIKVTVALPQLGDLFEKGKLLPTGSEKAISTVRTMLREKKGGI